MERRKTPEQIRQEGFEALFERLGKADAIRFIQLFDPGKGNYAVERHEWVDKTTMADIEKGLREIRKQQQNAGPKAKGKGKGNGRKKKPPRAG